MYIYNFRYLATGDCITSTQFSYLVSPTATGNIIKETCEAIWTVLAKDVMPGKLSKQDWLKVSGRFQKEWHFPHCIGALDGKHVHIQVVNNKLLVNIILIVKKLIDFLISVSR